MKKISNAKMVKASLIQSPPDQPITIRKPDQNILFYLASLDRFGPKKLFMTLLFYKTV